MNTVTLTKRIVAQRNADKPYPLVELEVADRVDAPITDFGFPVELNEYYNALHPMISQIIWVMGYKAASKPAEGEWKTKVEELIPQLKKFIKQYPTSAEAHFFLGMSYKFVGEYTNAYTQLQKAYQHDNRIYDIPRALCVTAMILNKPQAAMQYAKDALAMDPGFSMTMLNYFALLLATKQTDNATRYLEAVGTNDFMELEYEVMTKLYGKVTSGKRSATDVQYLIKQGYLTDFENHNLSPFVGKARW